MRPRRTISIFMLCLLGTSAVAQNVRIVSPPEQIPLPYASAARISPTGELVSFTGESFNKLFVADVEGSNLRELCSHDAVGWGYRWSPDGKYIAVRANHPLQQTKRVSIELLDVENNVELAVTDPLSPRGRVSLPQWTGKDLFAFSTQAGLEVRRIELKDSALTLVAVERQEISFSRWSTDALEKYDSAKVTRVRPFRQARTILNSAWSPSNKVSAVEFSGRPSLYAIARDGKSPLLIDAKGESPCWLNDNYIVYMVTEDDGHRILSGNIWIADKEGKMKKNLTEGFGEIALYPSAALDGTIVFTTEGGAVYKMRIAVE